MADLPALTNSGYSDKECARINNELRPELLARLEAQVTDRAGDQPAELVTELVALYREVALRHTDAGWWMRIEALGSHIGNVVQREMTPQDKARLQAIASRRH